MAKGKKPDQEIIDAIAAATEPPAHLSDRSKALWRHLVPTEALSPQRLTLLRAALESLDRCDQIRVAITSDNLVSITERSGTAHLNPLLRAERDSKAQFLAAWRELGFQRDDFFDRYNPNDPYTFKRGAL